MRVRSSAIEWMSVKRAGECASSPARSPRTAAMRPLTLSAGSSPPEPAFADCPIFTSTASARAICCSFQPK